MVRRGFSEVMTLGFWREEKIAPLKDGKVRGHLFDLGRILEGPSGLEEQWRVTDEEEDVKDGGEVR